MNEPQFSWDPRKARENAAKHGISFDEASTAFRDEGGLRIFDPDHSVEEDRYLLLAMSGKGRLLVVCHSFRKRRRGNPHHLGPEGDKNRISSIH
jgi:hypothetical protein